MPSMADFNKFLNSTAQQYQGAKAQADNKKPLDNPGNACPTCGAQKSGATMGPNQGPQLPGSNPPTPSISSTPVSASPAMSGPDAGSDPCPTCGLGMIS